MHNPRREKKWTIESAKMSDVYAHAYLTISATNSHDDTKVFLCPRPSKYSSLRITSSIPGKSAQVYLQYDRDAPKMIGGGMTKHQPLDARGWTLQEHVLSPRFLRFHHDQLRFKCRQHIYVECERKSHRDFLAPASAVLVKAKRKPDNNYDSQRLLMSRKSRTWPWHPGAR